MLELITVLAILGVMAAVVAAAIPAPGSDPPPESLAAARVRLAEARREAITRGRPVTVTVRFASSDTGRHSPVAEWRATARPDGSIVADPALAIERLTGRPLSGEVGR